MAQSYWFRRHKKGIVWYPVSWQGWLTVLIYISGLIYYFIQVDNSFYSISDTLINFAAPFFILSASLIIITYLKSEPLKK